MATTAEEKKPDSKEPQPTTADSAATTSYYGYLFKNDNTPTKTLDALLRAIGQHIALEIGDKNDNALTPKKLAAFYKAVGGDYDSLFVGMPYPSISYIWQVTGCQHTMQPNGNDFEAPSVPALTLRGFVRWESIEILLGPEEHVPFLQYAVKNWSLKHPETGELFPVDLPKVAFPSKPDKEIDRWHKACAEKLRQEATPKEDQVAATRLAPAGAPVERDEPRVKAAYMHVRNPYPEPSPRTRGSQSDYFNRPVAFAHVPGRHGAPRVNVPRSPDRERLRQGSSSAEEHARRRSFSDYPSPPNETMHSSIHLEPNRVQPPQQRRHSQPRHYSSSSTSGSDSPTSPRTKRRSHTHHSNEPPPPSIRRFAPPSAPQPPPAAPAAPPAVGGFRSHRAELRQDDPRRRSFPIPFEGFRDKFNDKVAAILPNGRSPERPRSSSRRKEVHHRGSRDHLPNSRLSRSWSDLRSDDSDNPESSGAERRRRRRLKERREKEERERERDRERERERDRGRDRGHDRDHDRDWDEEREARKRREHRAYLQRPDNQRRTSSHADVDRVRDESWDPRDRDQPRDDRKRWKERGPSPVVTGVGGRRYPAEMAWN